MKLVDTSFLVALQLRRDANHADAAALWSMIRDPLLLTNHVLGETWTFLRRRVGHDPAHRFVMRARDSRRLVRVHVDAETEVAAWRWLARHDEREYSFVDATSFALRPSGPATDEP